MLTARSTLEDILNADPITAIYAAMEKAEQAFVEKNPEEAKIYKEVTKEMNKGYAEFKEYNPKLLDHLQKLCAGLEDAEERYLEQARIHNVSVDRIKFAEGFAEEMDEAVERAVSSDTLIRSWKSLKRWANIADVGEENFPEKLERPMLVLYSADWCSPCRVIRPTFARLVRFFDKADVGYCHEDEYRRKKGVEFIPQFVAYFPNGGSVASYPGSTTQEVWNTMNMLIGLGKSWEGEGKLVCDEYICKIVPVTK